MKLEPIFTNSYFKCYNEAQGVADAKNLILKTKNTDVTTHLENVLFLCLLILLISVLCLLLKYYLCFYLCFFGNIIYFLTNIFYLLNKAINGPITKGTTMITRDGIMNDSFQNIQMLFPWELIQAVVVKKYTICILTSTSCFFYFDISYKDKIIATLEKYNKTKLLIGTKKRRSKSHRATKSTNK